MTNLERAQNALKTAEIPAFLMSDLSNIFWVSGFSGSFGQIILTPEVPLLLTDSRYTLQAQEQAVGFEVRSFGQPTTSTEFLKEQVEALAVAQLHFDENVVTVSTLRQWQEKMPAVEFLPATDPVGQLRMIKSPEEIARMRHACRLAEACLEHLLPLIRPGVTEYALLAEIEYFLRKQGSVVAFTPIVVSGERSARPHGTASEKPLEVGDFVTFDLGAKSDGYCSDITRTFVVGEATERHREVYSQVLKAEEEAIAALQPGANGREVDALARRILDEKGLASYFGHGLGHGLGALVHDTGRLTSSTDQLIEVGQVWTVEPGVYIPGFGGVRIEDNVLITPDGPEVLTHFPKDLMVLGG